MDIRPSPKTDIGLLLLVVYSLVPSPSQSGGRTAAALPTRVRVTVRVTD